MNEVATIEVKSGKTERVLNIPTPKILLCQNLQEVIALATEDLAFNKVMAQLLIDFRAKIRALMESETDGNLTYTDDDILGQSFTDWVPEGRKRLSEEEKVKKALGNIDPAVAAEILKKLAKAMAKG